LHLPGIARSLASRKCGFGKNENYVTVDISVVGATTHRYGVFFNIKIWRRSEDTPGLLLIIQSAYALSPEKQLPARGSRRFTRLVELTLLGIKPRPPR
jgi:hypothetical protein